MASKVIGSGLGGPSSGSSQKLQGGQVTKVAIRDGKRISVNDHVYITAPWAPGAGEPYIIARVMEFVTASSSRSGAAALASSSGTLQVRANVFLRMRDISHRTSNDSRLLVATMHSDVYSLDNVRGLCEVRHRDLIGDAPDVSAWKKREDHFYYYQLYDRYIHRFYDVIPTQKLQNAPADVLDVLRKRYSFIVAETGMVNDLCDALRGCAVCQQWASAVETVRCDTCKKFFHMRCLNPPLTSKPAKGYSWTCAPCSRRYEQNVARELESSTPDSLSRLPGTQGALVRTGSSSGSSDYGGAGQVKPRSAATIGGVPGSAGRGRPSGSKRRGVEDGPSSSATGTPNGTPGPPEKTVDDTRGTRCFQGWPYRYFGQHTDAPDVLDPHDSIYPRSTTRLGPKFQATLPTWEEQQRMGLGVAVRVVAAEPPAGQAKEAATASSSSPAMASTSAAAAAAGSSSSGPPEDEAAARAYWLKRPRNRRGKPAQKLGLNVGPMSTKGTSSAGTGTDADTPGTTPTLGTVALPGEGGEVGAAAASPIREFERGTDESVDVYCNVNTLPPDSEALHYQDAYMMSAAYHFRPLHAFNVDFIDRAVKVFNDHNYEPIAALQEISRSTPEDFRIVHWNSKERKAFESVLKDWGCELRQMKKAIPTKPYYDIVRFFVTWKNEKLMEQRRAEKQAAEKAAKAGKGSKTATFDRDGSPSIPRAISPTMSVYDEKTIKATPTISCRMCETKSSSFWYKGPSVWTNRFLCDSCGLYWRKYAAEQTPVDLIATNPRKHVIEDNSLGVAPPIKIVKLAALKAADTNKAAAGAQSGAAAAAAAAAKATPPAPAPYVKPDPIRCVMCRKLEPKKRLQQCRQCSLSVHQGCFGLSDEELAAEIWFCDACTNERTLDAALVPRCTLCPPLPKADPAKAAATTTASNGTSSTSTPTLTAAAARVRNTDVSSSPLSSSSSTAEPPLTALDAYKPTECNNWAHAICAVWMPDVLFTDTEKLKLVEGAGSLPYWRYASTCEVCNRPGGACIQCSDSTCKRTFHVSCAFAHSSYSFGFEIHPVKTSRKDQVATAGFKSEHGHWTALAFCKAHKEQVKEKQTYDLAEVDAKTGLTALQTYVRSHKAAIAPAAGTAAGGGGGNAAAAAAATATPAGAAAGDATYALLRRAKRFDAVFTSEADNVGVRAAGGPSAPTPSNTSTPSRHAGTAGPSRNNAVPPSGSSSSQAFQASSTTSSTAPHRRAKHCVRCETTFSPIWWPVSGRSTTLNPTDNMSLDHLLVDDTALLPLNATRPPVSQQPRERAVCCNICRFSLESVAKALERGDGDVVMENGVTAEGSQSQNGGGSAGVGSGGPSLVAAV